MDLPPDLLERPAKESARRLALSFLEAAAAAQQRLADASDPEALHDFRVALRRLRSCLRAYKTHLKGSVSNKTRRRLRALAAATGESRDTEVHLTWLREQRTGMRTRERHGVSWLIDRLTARKQMVDAELHQEVVDDFARMHRQLGTRLRCYTTDVHLDCPRLDPTLAAVLSDLVRQHAEELEHCLTAVRSTADQKEAHEARIAGKRLRYLLEPIAVEVESAADAVQRLKALQDALGDLHDAHVFSQELDIAVAEAAAEHARALATIVRNSDADGAGMRREQRRDPRPGLLTITQRLHERGERAFTQVHSEWLAGHAAGFFDAMRRTASEISRRATRGMEIERKYLLSRLPEVVEDADVVDIDQGWLPGIRLAERLRRVQSGADERCFRTVKAGSGVSRIEIEEETTSEVFATLWPLTAGRRVRKRRYSLPDGDHTWEIDEFTDRALVLAEVELPSENAPVEPPDWLRPHVVREVTGEPEFVNINLAR